MKKVKILKPVIGLFGLAVFVGDTTEVQEALANELIEQGYAELTKEEKDEKDLKEVIEDMTAKENTKKEKAVKK